MTARSLCSTLFRLLWYVNVWLVKVPEQLRTVDVAESEYIASILALNSYTTEFQPEMEAKLKQFQVLGAVAALFWYCSRLL